MGVKFAEMKVPSADIMEYMNQCMRAENHAVLEKALSDCTMATRNTLMLALQAANAKEGTWRDASRGGHYIPSQRSEGGP